MLWGLNCLCSSHILHETDVPQGTITSSERRTRMSSHPGWSGSVWGLIRWVWGCSEQRAPGSWWFSSYYWPINTRVCISWLWEVVTCAGRVHSVSVSRQAAVRCDVRQQVVREQDVTEVLQHPLGSVQTCSTECVCEIVNAGCTAWKSTVGLPHPTPHVLWELPRW